MPDGLISRLACPESTDHKKGYTMDEEVEISEFEAGADAAANQPTLDCVDFMAQQGGGA